MLQWALKWRYVLFILATSLAMALQSADVAEHAWARYTAASIILIALTAWAAAILMKLR